MTSISFDHASSYSCRTILHCQQERLLQNRVYLSPSVSYIAFTIDHDAHASNIPEDIISEAFERLADSISIDKTTRYNSLITVALYEFLTFTEAYGWQPLFFDVAERLVPILKAQGLVVMTQHCQNSEFKYFACRHPVFALLAQ